MHYNVPHSEQTFWMAAYNGYRNANILLVVLNRVTTLIQKKFQFKNSNKKQTTSSFCNFLTYWPLIIGLFASFVAVIYIWKTNWKLPDPVKKADSHRRGGKKGGDSSRGGKKSSHGSGSSSYSGSSRSDKSRKNLASGKETMRASPQKIDKNKGDRK